MAVDEGGNVVRWPADKSKRERTRETRPDPQADYWPQNHGAEEALLGAVLIDPEIAEACRDVLPRHFHNERNRTIWQAICDLRERGEPSDVVILGDLLSQRQQLDADGDAYLASLSKRVPTSGNARYYANIIKRTAWQRQMLEFGGSFGEVALKDSEEAVAAFWLAMRAEIDEELSDIRREHGLILMTDLEAEALPPAKGILGDILYEDTVAFMYGPPGRWKSFVALSWALSIGAGRPWLGREVTAGDVVYVAAEGARGIGKRIRAWKRRHGLDGKQTRLRVLGVPVQLLQPESVEQLLAVIKAADITPSLIVIDTLARSMAGGDENAAKDANLAIDAASTIKSAFGCCVLLVHHPGKDAAKGLRGSSALLGNADTVICVTGTEDDKKRRIEPGDLITVSSEKPKDSEPFADITLTTEKETWATDDGLFVSSLVIVPTEAPEREDPKPRGPSPKQRITLDILRDAPRGLSANAWQKQAQLAGGLSRSEFFLCCKQWQAEGVIVLGDDGCYTVALAGPVRSG